jgi:tRNA 2-thiocytidine biosynthesis protein TtcA
MGKAIHTRGMIGNGDRVMVAVSGGLDSLSLLWLLRERLSRIPISYTLTAVHVDLGFGAGSADQMESFFVKNGFDYRIDHNRYRREAHSPENRKALASSVWLRRKTLFKQQRKAALRKSPWSPQGRYLKFFLNVFYTPPSAP